MSAAWYDPRIARGMALQLTRWHQRLKAGGKALGWKVGFGSPQAMERYRLQAPLVGHLTDESIVRPGDPVSLEGWTRPIAEPEIAIHLGKNVFRGASRDTAAAAIAAIAPAIELADVTEPPEDVAAILAGNIYHRHVLLGPREARPGGSVEGLVGLVTRNGAEVATVSELQAAVGDYVDIVRHVADLLAAFGERLSAGEIIITGSIVAPMPVEPGDEIGFALQGRGSVSVKLKKQ